MKITKLFRSLTIPACLTALAAVFPQVVPANAADSARVSLDDDWRFIRNDPSGITDNLTYPRAPRTDRRGSAATNATAAFSPTSGIAQYILPTGNNFIADPAKRYPKPDGNYGGEIPYVNPSFDDSAWSSSICRTISASRGRSFRQGRRFRWATGAAVFRRGLVSQTPRHPGRRCRQANFLDIDGAMSYSTVWCNGQIVGGWPYGYASYRLDLTPFLKPGADNVLAIRLDNPNNSSRWYPGGGIYRNVWLTKTSPVHVPMGHLHHHARSFQQIRHRQNSERHVDNNSRATRTVTRRHRHLSP